MKRSKSYRNVCGRIDRTHRYAPDEAIALAKSTSITAFTPTMEVALRLGVDPRKADQMVRGTVVLPHGTGKPVRVLVVATGDHAQAAAEAGADLVGGQDLIQRIHDGFLGFDVVVATPEMMSAVGAVGRILGPRGLMPNPKMGTVTSAVAEAVTEIKRGKVEFRVDRHANLHIAIGTGALTDAALVANYEAVVDAVTALKPSAAKGRYLRTGAVTTTMGPSIPLAV